MVASRTKVKITTKFCARRCSQLVSQSVSRPFSQSPVTQPVTQPVSHSASQSVSHLASPCSQPVTQPVTQTVCAVSQSLSQSASRSEKEEEGGGLSHRADGRQRLYRQLPDAHLRGTPPGAPPPPSSHLSGAPLPPERSARGAGVHLLQLPLRLIQLVCHLRSRRMATYLRIGRRRIRADGDPYRRDCRDCRDADRRASSLTVGWQRIRLSDNDPDYSRIAIPTFGWESKIGCRTDTTVRRATSRWRGEASEASASDRNESRNRRGSQHGRGRMGALGRGGGQVLAGGDDQE
eukprot:599047-Prorocentrum_minimum.AAC.1